MASSRYSLTVFGATGFTARFVVSTIAEQIQQITSSGDDEHFTWAIAGRNEAALNEIRTGLKSTVQKEEWLPHVVVADIKDQASLKKMAESTKLVLNCVGPYAFLGESVVKAVLSANESLNQDGSSPCDYIDLCGEPAWIEEMVLRYGDRAARLGASVVHAAAFDSVPSDLGCVLAKDQLVKKDAVPTSVEAFVKLHIHGSKGFGIHYATYEAAINGFSTRKQLSMVRRQLFAKLPKVKPSPLQEQENSKTIRSSGLPNRKGHLGGAIKRIPASEKEVGGVYVLPFFFADPAVVRLSQHLSAYLNQEDINPPAQSIFWFVIPTLPILLLILIGLSLFGLMTTFSLGKMLLLKYPRFFSAGLVSHDGPTQEQLDTSSFTTTLVARGYSKDALQGGQTSPDIQSVVRITGPEVGYGSTPIIFVQVARTFLSERFSINNGVLTPASALAKTQLVQRLNKEGRVTFNVVS
ncbi:unnamed protein product [Sympodiomycopsis kandeliae]